MKKDDLKTGESKTSTSRRRLLTALTAGGAAAFTAPGEWTKPALKAVVLPAHAGTTPPDGGGGPQGCFFSAIFPYGQNDSFCMCVTATADGDCGSMARVEVRNGAGQILVACQAETAAFGEGGATLSWSCDGSTETDVPNGALVTFDVEFSNGCSCREVVGATA